MGSSSTGWHRLVLAAALLARGVSCIPVGFTPARYAPAISHRGAMVRAASLDGGAPTVGELVAATDSGIVVNDGRRLLHVHRRSLADVREQTLGTDLCRGCAESWARVAARLRLYSQFPQGLSPAVEQRLLQSLGQERIEPVAGDAARAGPTLRQDSTSSRGDG